MEIETVWGSVKTRASATRMTRTHHVLLKDNLNLKPVFDWLSNLKIKGKEDFKSEKVQKLLEGITFNREIKWSFEPSDFPMLTFQNSVPLEGDFENGIREVLNTFHLIMYNPEVAEI